MRKWWQSWQGFLRRFSFSEVFLLSILVVKDTFELKCSLLKCKFSLGNQACSRITTVNDLHGIIRLLSFWLRNVSWELVFWLVVKKREEMIIVLHDKLGEDGPRRMLLSGTRNLYLVRTNLTHFYILFCTLRVAIGIVIRETHPFLIHRSFKDDKKYSGSLQIHPYINGNIFYVFCK